ncbi:unnamed protein product [Rotaria sordida]|uniref:Uncharacterized protein n=1 Tax=Rotaria sordida TaxID=392033 RepID=A0A814LDD5_9BILA|nr:unnamed protein product [Rotaria sordida]CAF3928769.1 unnamed protein product [Rotaria sordida]
MESSNSNTNLTDKECYCCREEFNRFCLSISNCTQCNQLLCSECILIHCKKHEQEFIQIQDQYNDLKNKINEKEKYINDTSNESIEIIINWYQRLINDLIETQTQIIENIQNERDRARDELGQFDITMHSIDKDIIEFNQNININSIKIKLNDLTTKLSNYRLTKDIYLPDSHTFQPQYKVSYHFKDSSSIEEDWDIDTNTGTNIPLPSHRSLMSTNQTTTTTPLFFSNNSQTFITPKDDDEDNFQWLKEIETNNKDDSEYLLDPRLYHLGTSRHFNYDIHLIASNGNDLLCYSRQTKQLIFIGDGNMNPIILQWYHGHMIQLVWFDNLKSFITITDDSQYEIYTIESTYNLRLKISLRTCLPNNNNNNIIKDQIFMRTDEYHIYIYYERIDGQKRLRLLSSTFEYVRSYSIDKFFQIDEHIHSHENGSVVGLGINQEYVVLFVRLTIDDDLAGQAASQIEETYLLVFNKSKMCFIRRINLSNRYSQLPFIVHFINISSFFIIDQIYHMLRFFHYEKEIGQIKLISSNISSISNSITTTKSNIDYSYSSIVLMNDGSLLISNNTQNLIQLILNDQANDIDDW